MNLTGEEPEVPVWFKRKQKWITGLTRRTTCDDVIYAVLCDFCAKHFDVSEYAIWERWRGVERPLRGRTKVLKLWSAWEKMTNNVQLIIRRVESVVDSSSEVFSRRVKRRTNRKRIGGEGGGISEEFKSDRKTYLVKVVAEREDLIQKHQHRMRKIDDDITQHEDRIHQLRMRRKGRDYLQEAYLRTGEESGSTASSNDDYRITEYSKQLEAYLELSTRVLAVHDELENAQKRATELSELIAQESGSGDLKKQLLKADDLNATQLHELSVMDQSIKEYDEVLSRKERFFEDLIEEPGYDDNDGIPHAKDKPKSLKKVEDFEPYMTYMTYYRRKDDDPGGVKGQPEDSNSDTGLSSLHSDEGAPVLETLV